MRTQIIALTALALSGCAVLSTGPDPKVEDCALIRQATPGEFYCGGYGTCTTVQLTAIRDGTATSCKKTAANTPSRSVRDAVRTDQHEPTIG
jgi:hypothetical protein